MTVPADWPEERIWEYISCFYTGYENAGCLKGVCNYLGLSERRFREWMEVQREYPIATDSRGVWACVRKKDWHPAICWRIQRIRSERKAIDRLKWMRINHNPKLPTLFDADKYKEEAA